MSCLGLSLFHISPKPQTSHAFAFSKSSMQISKKPVFIFLICTFIIGPSPTITTLQILFSKVFKVPMIKSKSFLSTSVSSKFIAIKELVDGHLITFKSSVNFLITKSLLSNNPSRCSHQILPLLYESSKDFFSNRLHNCS